MNCENENTKILNEMNIWWKIRLGSWIFSFIILFLSFNLIFFSSSSLDSTFFSWLSLLTFSSTGKTNPIWPTRKIDLLEKLQMWPKKTRSFMSVQRLWAMNRKTAVSWTSTFLQEKDKNKRKVSLDSSTAYLVHFRVIAEVTKYLMAQRTSILSCAYSCFESTSSIKFTIPCCVKSSVETAIILILGLCLSDRQN